MNYERREKIRYPLELSARYQTSGAAGAIAGVGQTVNISSRGMRLACQSSISEGTRLTVFLEWPSLLNGITPLQLITIGTVVRRDHAGLSIVCESYQFRTMGRARPSSLSQRPDPVSCSYGDSQPLAFVAKSSSDF